MAVSNLLRTPIAPCLFSPAKVVNPSNKNKLFKLILHFIFRCPRHCSSAAAGDDPQMGIFLKKKVVMRVGYVGSDYRAGLRSFYSWCR